MAYRIDVRPLLASLSADRTVDGQLSLADIELGEQRYHFPEPVSFEVTLTNTGAGVVAQGTATAEVETACVRCLCDTKLALTAAVEGFFVLPARSHELPEEQEFELIAADMSIDLEAVVVQSLVVELPFAPVHDEACKGICPVCGADRNVTECGCEVTASASPFDALKGLPLEMPADS